MVEFGMPSTARRSAGSSLTDLLALQWRSVETGSASWQRPMRGGVWVFDTATGTELLRLDGHSARVHQASFSPDGRHLVTANGNQTTSLWLLHDGPGGRWADDFTVDEP